MQLYSGTSKDFILDSTQNQVADKLAAAFLDYYSRKPTQGERASWQNSLRAMSQVVQYAGLLDHGVVLEYELPRSSARIDCLLTGHDAHGRPQAVVVELKQWERAEVANGDRVMTWVAGGYRDLLHPSAQARQYRDYLADYHTVFHGPDPVGLAACSYLHNYALAADDPLLEEKYRPFMDEVPLFSKDHVPILRDFLLRRLSKGDGMPVLDRVLVSEYRPSKKLLKHMAALVKAKPEYVLLDDQVVVHDQIVALLRKGIHKERKQVIIVHGGPGTGKSVIALNLFGTLSGKGFVAHYVTGSRSFTETLKTIVGRGGGLFRYFNSYTEAPADAVDILICDEAHRIRATSDTWRTPKAKRTGKPQIQELLAAGRALVFFVDDHQVVRPNEIGSAAYIRAEAIAAGADVREYVLETQFRCAGSDAFVAWVDNTLHIRRTANPLWDGSEGFEFRIMDTVEELDEAIRARQAEGHSARLVAGYCWDWSDPKPDGTLVDDVQIGSFRRPWNAKPDATHLAPGIPSSNLWAYDPNGRAQVGCIYTAQGFEFDYAGVIFGRDLRYDPRAAEWEGHPEESFDRTVKRGGDDFLRLVKNTYRVLLTRGMKGCYVHFLDEATRNFVVSRIGRHSQAAGTGRSKP